VVRTGSGTAEGVRPGARSSLVGTDGGGDGNPSIGIAGTR